MQEPGAAKLPQHLFMGLVLPFPQADSPMGCSSPRDAQPAQHTQLWKKNSCFFVGADKNSLPWGYED